MPTHSSRLNPPLKWAGGKRWLVPQLTELFAQESPNRLVEPFCGGLAVALGLSPQNALLNDSNPHVINFYRQLAQGLSLDIEARNESELYYRHRSRFNALISDGQAHSSEAAQLFYYLIRTGFNGLCRFNKSGHFNVPFGRYKAINYTPDFSPFVEQFKNWDFSNGDFSQLQIQNGDLIYADPPYDVEFTQYSAGGFSWEDQERLIEWLAQHDGPIILSNQSTPRIRDLYQNAGYHILELDAPRRISCTGNRTPAREVLATRNLQKSYEEHDHGKGI